MTGPLTLGTAGHIDHGKTALVRALTGVDTDRLPEEHRRGISIALGYAPLALGSGRAVSVVDVPGHERFVKTMVSGATGIDLYLMVVAADDGVMPQTVEHAAVLEALGVRTGVVAITKADLADPRRAEREARELLPDASAVVTCSGLTGVGVAQLRAALQRVAADVRTRAEDPGEPLLHVDRAFSVTGIGTVVTGTLWSGVLSVADRLTLLPGARAVRVRGLQVHDEPCASAAAGQRVAVNLVGVRAREVARGDALAAPGRVRETTCLDCELALLPDARHSERVQVHHGTRDVPGRLADLGEGLWQLRLEKPLLAADGDRVVVRRLSPPDTLGGGRVLDAAAPRHGRRPDVLARLRRLAAGTPAPPATGPVPAPHGLAPSPHARQFEKSPYRCLFELADAGLALAASRPAAETQREAIAELEAALRDAGRALLRADPDAVDRVALSALCDAGRAVRVSGRLYAHAEVVADASERIIDLIAARGSVSLAEVRDALGTGRKSAQALLEYLDTQRVTRREPDDRRVLRHRHATRALP